MITLADLAALQQEHADAWRLPVEPVTVTGPSGDVVLGDGAVALMGCVNLSRDSTYRESIAFSTDDAVRMGRVQVAQGAAVIDLGAESSSAKASRVGADAQATALVPVVEALATEALVSVETYEPDVVRKCLEAGARVLNMTGREHEDEMLALAAEHDAAVVMCFGVAANVREPSDVPPDADPIPVLVDHFGARLERARELGATKVVVDPGMGFHYGNLLDLDTRVRHQTRVLAQAFRLRELGAPVLNVLPHALHVFGDEFRKAEGFFAVFAALGGAHMLRVHEVAHVRTVLSALQTGSVR